MQEAFVAALLSIARRTDGVKDAVAEDPDGSDGEWVDVLAGEEKGGDEDKDLEKYVLWVEIKKQVEILREGMGEKE